MTEREKPHRTEETARREPGAGAGSDVWLARLFLLAVGGMGLVSLLSGASPESLAFWPCPFHSVTKMPCPGCGMTRACIALARGDIGSALHYNPLSLGLVFFAGVFALAPHRVRRCWRGLSGNARSTFTWSMLVLVFGFWAVRIML